MTLTHEKYKITEQDILAHAAFCQKIFKENEARPTRAKNIPTIFEFIMDNNKDIAKDSISFKAKLNLEGADLYLANLEGANLKGANLKNSNLIKARLVNADLSKANLSNADLGSANLVNANLTGVIGLDNADTSYAKFSKIQSEEAKKVVKIFKDRNGDSLNEQLYQENKLSTFLVKIKFYLWNRNFVEIIQTITVDLVVIIVDLIALTISLITTLVSFISKIGYLLIKLTFSKISQLIK